MSKKRDHRIYKHCNNTETCKRPKVGTIGKDQRVCEECKKDYEQN